MTSLWWHELIKNSKCWNQCCTQNTRHVDGKFLRSVVSSGGVTTVTTHQRNGVSNHWQFNCCLSQFPMEKPWRQSASQGSTKTVYRTETKQSKACAYFQFPLVNDNKNAEHCPPNHCLHKLFGVSDLKHCCFIEPRRARPHGWLGSRCVLPMIPK